MDGSCFVNEAHADTLQSAMRAALRRIATLNVDELSTRLSYL